MTTERSLVHINRALRVLIVEDKEADYGRVVAALDDMGLPIEHEWETSYEGAREVLATRPLDFLILDLVLNEATERDRDSWEGLNLLWDVYELGLQNELPIIILTGHEDPELTRDAFIRYHVLDFLPKRLSSEALMQELLGAFERKAYSGTRCEIALSSELGGWVGLVNAALGRDVRGLRWRLLGGMAEVELRALFERMFVDCERVNVRSLDRGFSGAGVVRAERVFEHDERGSDVVVKYGQVEDITREREGWHSVKRFLNGERATRIEASASGLALSAISYSFVGGGHTPVVPFTEFCARSDLKDVLSCIDSLFLDTCGLWYDSHNRTATETLNIGELYRECLGILPERVFEGYKFRFGARATVEGRAVRIEPLGLAVPHAVNAVRAGELDYEVETWRCRSHGDLHGRNVLVRDASSAWLIDFGRTGFGHWARDFAQLEAFVRFQTVFSSDLGELRKMELALAAPVSLGEPVSFDDLVDNGVRRAGLIIERIRRVAAELIAPWPLDVAMIEYHLALIWSTMKYFELQALLDKKFRKNQVLLTAGIGLGIVRERAESCGLRKRWDTP